MTVRRIQSAGLWTLLLAPWLAALPPICESAPLDTESIARPDVAAVTASASVALSADLAPLALRPPQAAAPSPPVSVSSPGPQNPPATIARPLAAPRVYEPLTVRRKFLYGLERGLGPASLVGAFATAGYQQYFDHNKGYGQGADGYFARAGARYAKTGTKHLLGSFILASVFRQDPRFLRSNAPSTKTRLAYAITRVVVATGDNGRPMINIAGLGGNAGAAFISKTWHRPPDDTWRRAGSRFGYSLGIEAGRNIIREFWPEIRRLLGRR